MAEDTIHDGEWLGATRITRGDGLVTASVAESRLTLNGICLNAGRSHTDVSVGIGGALVMRHISGLHPYWLQGATNVALGSDDSEGVYMIIDSPSMHSEGYRRFIDGSTLHGLMEIVEVMGMLERSSDNFPDTFSITKPYGRNPTTLNVSGVAEVSEPSLRKSRGPEVHTTVHCGRNDQRHNDRYRGQGRRQFLPHPIRRYG